MASSNSFLPSPVAQENRMPGTAFPVSYTHLDVYKRQLHASTRQDVSSASPFARACTSSVRLLGQGGRMAVITFHSLEDRRVRCV